MILIVFVSLIIYFIDLAKKGKEIIIRKLSPIDAIDEIVGRASEMGRPIHYTFGTGGMTSSANAPQFFASVGILGKVAERTADLGVELIVSLCQAPALPLIDDMISSAYRLAGKAGEYSRDIIRFQSTGYAYRAAVIGTIESEKPAGNFVIGGFYNEMLTFIEVGARVGAMQVGGTASIHQLAFIAAVCDYALLGEELYAAGAYMSQEPSELASIAGQDIMKYVVIALIALGVICENAGITWITQLLTM